MRQTRVKRDCDLPAQFSVPDSALDRDEYQLRVPTPRIERHASEPAPSTSMFIGHGRSQQTPSNLTVPQPYLVKQHSHPLLPSQLVSNPPIVQRQLSQSGQRSRVSLHQQHRLMTQSSSLSLDSAEDYLATGTTPNVLSVIERQSSPPNNNRLVATSSAGLSPAMDEVEDVSISAGGATTTTTTTPLLIVSGPVTGSLDYAPVLRAKDELQRSISTPHAPTRELSLENRSSHCPAIRPGPALGCNFCWNTIDAHGRILRRKTKYHCPECQTNLCIVPCFQEYHERQQTTEQASTTTTTATTLSASPGSKTACGGVEKPKFQAFSASSSSTACSSPSSGGSTTVQQPPDFSQQ